MIKKINIENENIPKTNNWLELFFNIVFPKKYCKRFRTLWGVKTFLRYGKIRWYERVVLKEKIQINRKICYPKRFLTMPFNG